MRVVFRLFWASLVRPVIVLLILFSVTSLCPFHSIVMTTQCSFQVLPTSVLFTVSGVTNDRSFSSMVWLVSIIFTVFGVNIECPYHPLCYDQWAPLSPSLLWPMSVRPLCYDQQVPLSPSLLWPMSVHPLCYDQWVFTLFVMTTECSPSLLWSRSILFTLFVMSWYAGHTDTAQSFIGFCR